MYLDVSCYVSSVTHRKRARYMYLDVSDVYPKMYLGLVWDTCKIHAICQDTCILLECNRAFKIHLRYIRIHSRYVYPTGYMQDTCRIHQNTSGYVSDRKLHPKTIGNPPAPLEPLVGSRLAAMLAAVGEMKGESARSRRAADA